MCRATAVTWVTAVALINFFFPLQCSTNLDNFNFNLLSSHPIDALGALVVVFAIFIASPVFLIYRAMTAPLESRVFLIIFISCAASTYFYIKCGFPEYPCSGTDLRGLFCLLATGVTGMSAFLCLFPKWSNRS